MTLEDFIREHGSEIDAAINREIYRHDGRGGKGVIPDPAPTYDDDERRQWVENDEGLYEWARSEGVSDL